MNYASIPNAFTVDVEDYFQVTGFEHRVSRKNWDSYESRVERNTDKMLSLLDRYSVCGTFFVLGWVADRFPALVKRIDAAGHELASHGYWHQLVYNQTPEEFIKDIRDSRDAIATACSAEIKMYRAPSFSIVRKSMWALEALVENGFTVDSSIFPIRGHHRYGVPDARLDIHSISTKAGKIIEFPPSVWSLGPITLPIGGGYFRILPTSLSMKGIEFVRQDDRPAMFYIHPWEIDPDQPRIESVGLRNRFRHYSRLKTTESRLCRLLEKVPFGTMSEVLNSYSLTNELGEHELSISGATL